jgi:hypothetical protein
LRECVAIADRNRRTSSRQSSQRILLAAQLLDVAAVKRDPVPAREAVELLEVARVTTPERLMDARDWRLRYLQCLIAAAAGQSAVVDEEPRRAGTPDRSRSGAGRSRARAAVAPGRDMPRARSQHARAHGHGGRARASTKPSRRSIPPVDTRNPPERGTRRPDEVACGRSTDGRPEVTREPESAKCWREPGTVVAWVVSADVRPLEPTSEFPPMNASPTSP